MRRTYQGACHCGQVKFEIDADIDHVRICDCSVCTKRAVLIHRVSLKDFRLLTPLDLLSLYRWGSFTAEDYFCPKCGVLPFRKPSHRSQQEIAEGIEPFNGWAINTLCLKDFDPRSVPLRQISGSRISLP